MEKRTYKVIQWFNVDGKIIKSQRSTNDRELAFSLFEDGFKAKMFRGKSGLLIRERGFD